MVLQIQYMFVKFAAILFQPSLTFVAEAFRVEHLILHYLKIFASGKRSSLVWPIVGNDKVFV